MTDIQSRNGKIMRQKVIGTILSLLLLGSTFSAAQALVYDGTKYGSYITTSGNKISLTDNQDDGQFPSVNYTFDKRKQKGGFNNKLGYNVTVTKRATSTVVGIQPCVSRTLLPSNCGGWIGQKPL